MKTTEVLIIILKLSMAHGDFSAYNPQQVQIPYILRPGMKSLAEDPATECSPAAILSTPDQQRGKTQILL